MKLPITALCFIALILTGCSSGIQFEKPQKVPRASTENQQALIDAGVVAHDKGDYDKAIENYQKVLAENPENVTALYEEAFSYAAKQDWTKSLELGMMCTQYQSNNLNRAYTLIGNALDNLGRSKDALAVYKHILEMNPYDYLAEFNLGITYFRLGELTDAKDCFKSAVKLKPDHPGSHLFLGKALFKEGNNIPAFFALCRFLILEPDTKRAEDARLLLTAILTGNMEKDNKKPKQVNIHINMNAPKDEGDFTSANLILVLLAANLYVEDNSGKFDARKLSELLESMTKVIAEKPDTSKFIFSYYVPYFKNMQEKKYFLPMTQHILQTGEMSKTAISEFLNWSKFYAWK